ncbi:hypothetical protein AB0M28_06155 [Streptomyces sp. NPDC051940]|uniref:hypothetical protein n=1 Tax=Streptomyces sp. NPDC051940 TaxID=3155675 RepID=UPI00341546B2
MSVPRTYRYLGPPDLRESAGPATQGRRIATPSDFATWIAEQTAQDLADPFPYVIDTTGTLRLAPRRSEHVACAGGEEVLAAGEMGFTREAAGWRARPVSNHSTGYCPDTTSWPAVATALSHAGLGHDTSFTHEVVFRRCPSCHERTIVHESHYACAFCDTDLPATWNLDG